MGAVFPMILRESALFSRGCKLISLRSVPCQVTVKAFARQAPWNVPWFVASQGISGGMTGSKAIDFYAFSRGIPRKEA